jgi:hypothetical protein
MNTTNPNSGLNQKSDGVIQTHPWLQKHHQQKRERTVRLVKAAVDQLIKEQQTVTIEAICRKSTEVDPDGRGIKKSAVLENAEAHDYYRKHSTSYQTMKQRNRKQGRNPSTSAQQSLHIDPHRDVDRVRYRYLQMMKSEIVERLLIVEQAYAELAEQQARLQFEWLEFHQQQRKGATGGASL